MDSIEKTLRDIDAHKQQAITKHEELLAKAIVNSAKTSNQCARNLDNQFRRYFPEIDDIGESSEDAFNPTTIVEFREGKAHQVITSWDKYNGFLPYRKVVDRNTNYQGKDIPCAIFCGRCSKFHDLSWTGNHPNSIQVPCCDANYHQLLCEKKLSLLNNDREDVDLAGYIVKGQTTFYCHKCDNQCQCKYNNSANSQMTESGTPSTYKYSVLQCGRPYFVI